MDQPIQKEADAIAKELWLGKYQKAAGGDGEVWRVYEAGTVDGDVLGHVRGVWIGGAPWSQGSTFLSKKVVDAAVTGHLGHFQSSQKPGDQTRVVFARGVVTVDAKGNVSASDRS